MFRLVIAIVINPRLKRVTMPAWTLHAIVGVGLAVELIVDGGWVTLAPPQAMSVIEPTDGAVTHLVCAYANPIMLIFWLLSKACIVAFLVLMALVTRQVRAATGVDMENAD